MRPNVSISIEFGYGLTCYKRGLQGLKYGGGRQLLSVSGVLVGKSFDLSNNVVVERECTSVSWSLLFNYVNFQLSRSAIFLQTDVVLDDANGIQTLAKLGLDLDCEMMTLKMCWWIISGDFKKTQTCHWSADLTLKLFGSLTKMNSNSQCSWSTNKILFSRKFGCYLDAWKLFFLQLTLWGTNLRRVCFLCSFTAEPFQPYSEKRNSWSISIFFSIYKYDKYANP